nr:MAG TPA: hypothetical protein [Inoviridae sp.]
MKLAQVDKVCKPQLASNSKPHHYNPCHQYKDWC